MEVVLALFWGRGPPGQWAILLQKRVMALDGPVKSSAKAIS